MNIETLKRKTIYAIDVFCGVGGLTNGLKKAGIEVTLGIDNDSACEYPYTANNNARFLRKKIEDVGLEELRNIFPKNSIRLLAGCAPCQTFSQYYQKANKKDRRWHLLNHFWRLVMLLDPEFVTIENVPGISRHLIFDKFIKNLKRSNYYIYFQTINCADYGIPQERKRLVLLASKFGHIHLLSPKEINARKKTVKAAIGRLPPIKIGEVYKKDRMHQCSILSPMNLRRIRASNPGGTWRDWNSDMIAECHKKPKGKGYSSVYGRMLWEEPSPTITTQFYGFGNGRFGHPEQDRGISLREGAILQGFPKSYKFVDKGKPIFKKQIGKLIGNAVPVKLGEVIGMSFIKHVNNI